MPGFADKIRDREALTAAVAAWKAAGERVVLANGCFDLLHVGHVRYLEAARGLGERLVVAINSDASTRAAKGPGRPLLGQQGRAELVAGLRCVDAVTIFEEATVEALLRRLRPAIHAKGTDYAAGGVPEAAIAREVGAEVRLVGDPKQHSTRDLLARLRS